MHKIERNEPPEGLEEKLINFNNKDNIQPEDIKNAWQSFTNSKLKKQNLEQLNKMFKGCCAYCEGICESTSYLEIEHFRPKSIYPKLMFDYNNMNISCEKCNKKKKEKFDERLINPTVDNPQEHLKFETYLLVPIDERGMITIDIFDINNSSRTIKKEEGYETINNSLKLLKSKLDKIDEKNELAIEILRGWITSVIQEVEVMFEEGFEYCTMYRDNFKDDIEDLKKILKKIS